MRAGLVGVFFFVALLALGHYVAAPFFCRAGNVILAFDPRALCGADLHFNRSGSMLLYFGSIAIAFLFGAVAGVLPVRGASGTQEKTAEQSTDPLNQLLATEEKKAETKQASNEPVAHPSAAKTPAGESADAAKPDHASAKESPPAAEAPATSAANSETGSEAQAKADASTQEPAAQAVDPETAAASEKITLGLAAAKNGIRGAFDGSTEDLLARIRELKKQEGVNAIAQAQRLLDESTMAALGKGVDPKQHLSEVANLVLAEDPDLTSGVVRGVVVHIAARLKELGVANKMPEPAKGVV